MKLLTLAILLSMFALSAHAHGLEISRQDALNIVDLMMPVDPDARDGESADDLEAAKRIAESDILRFYDAMEEQPRNSTHIRESAERFERSLRTLGDIAGYTSPNVGKVNDTRSLSQYFLLLGYAQDAVKDWTFVEPQDAAEPIQEDAVPTEETARPPEYSPPEDAPERSVFQRFWDWLKSLF